MTEFRPFRFPRARFTKLSVCGVPDTSACAMWATSGVIELSMTGEELERDKITLQDGDGTLIGSETVEAQLEWLNVELTLTGVEPKLISWLTGATIIYDDTAPTPLAIGIADEVSGSANVNVSIEGWQRLFGTSCMGTNPVYGYVLLPWLTGGRMTDWKMNKGLADVKIQGLRTKGFSPWGVGPYAIQHSMAAATLGHPIPLLTAVTSTQHRLLMKTDMAPPLVTTDCGLVTGPLSVVDDDAGGPGKAATATLPVVPGILPCTIDWGDLAITHVTVGLTGAHTYAAIGTYTVTCTPDSQSGPKYVGTVTIA